MSQEKIQRIDAEVSHAGPAPRHLLQFIRHNRLYAEYLWGCCREDGRVETALLMVPQPGRASLCFLSKPAGFHGVERAARLIAAACDQAPEDWLLAQALVETGDRRSRSAYEQAGFWKLATLRYLQTHPSPQSPPPVWDQTALRLEPWSEARRPLFLEALEASYRQTLDCPKLQGLRTTADALAGHRGAGPFDPALWQVLLADDRPAGVLLINPLAIEHAAELVYLGLTPSHRGRGLGDALMREALHQCAARGVRTLVLAADEANEPALRLYARHGMARVDRKHAMVRALRAVHCPETA